MRRTPITSKGLVQYDSLPVDEAIAKAWNEPGDKPFYHEMMKDTVRDLMPLLGHALDRIDDKDG